MSTSSMIVGALALSVAVSCTETGSEVPLPASNAAPPDAAPTGPVRAQVVNDMPDASLNGWSFRAGIGTPMVTGLGPGQRSEELTMQVLPNALGFDRDADGRLDLWFETAGDTLAAATLLTVTMDGDEAVLAVLTADGSTILVPPSSNIPQFANLRALHLSPDAPDVSLFGRATGAPDSDASRLVDTLGFGTSTDYLKLSPAVYDLDVTPAGAPVSDTVLKAVNTQLDGLTFYTVAAYGPLADLAVLPLVDDRSQPAVGSTRLRVAHTASGVGTVNVLVRNADGSESPLVEELDFGTAADALEVPSVEYTVGLDVDDDLVSDLLFELPELPEGASLNLFAVNDAGDVSLAIQTGAGPVILVSGVPAPQAELRVLHLSPDAPKVDAFVGAGSVPAVEDLAFTEGTPYLGVAAGDTSLAIAAADAGRDHALFDVPIELDVDARYTAVAFDELHRLQPLLLRDDDEGISSSRSRVRFVHTAVHVHEVDVFLLPDAGAVISTAHDVAFGEASATVDVPDGKYTLGIDVDDDEILDAAFELPTLGAGDYTNLFAVTDSHGVLSIIVQ